MSPRMPWSVGNAEEIQQFDHEMIRVRRVGQTKAHDL